MMLKGKQTLLMAIIIIVAVVLDQLLKIYIVSNYHIGEVHEITSWFSLCYVENNGMAFGIEWFDKLFLTIFRIIAVLLLVWYSYTLIYKREQTRTGFLSMIALIMAGAIGNIIDCVFYGKIYGYADWFYGRVVDMLYFPLIHNSAGEVIFFRPVFNLADSCITCAVIAMLIWYRHDLDDSFKK